MPAGDEAASAGGSWSSANRALLERCRERPALGHRAAFAPLHQENPLPRYPSLQSWPVFADAARIRELERIAAGLTRLLKGVPARCFGGDCVRMAAFYGVDQPELLAAVLAEPNGIEAALARLDFLEDGSGLRCLELNAGSYVGGWYTERLAPLYLRCSELAAFLQGQGLRASHRPTIRLMFAHIVRDTRRRCRRDGELNLALVLHPQTDSFLRSLDPPELLQRELDAALAAEDPALRGSIFLCGYGDLEVGPAACRYRGRPVHAILEQQDGPTHPAAFRLFKAGSVNLFSGPVTGLLSDKRNLALLSAAAGEGGPPAGAAAPACPLSDDERRLVSRHLPWTRLAAPAAAVFRGAPVFVPDLLAGRREELVLKSAQSVGGADVHVGRFLAAGAWDEAVRHALAAPGWIVQEEVRALPWLLPAADEGLAAYDVVWGVFVFGESYGGTFVRMLPRERHGVVNVRQGCEVGIVLEVGAAGRDGAAPAGDAGDGTAAG